MKFFADVKHQETKEAAKFEIQYKTVKLCV